MSEQGKGDTPRPIVVDPETFKKNWEQTFKRPCCFVCGNSLPFGSMQCPALCHINGVAIGDLHDA